MKTAHIFTVLAMVLSLLLGSVGTAYAAPASQAAAQHGYFGTVSSVDGAVITLDTKSQGSVKITTDAGTIVHVPGKDSATLADVLKGVRIAVLALDQAGAQVALRIMVLPDAPVTIHISGVVTAVAGDKATITDKDGNVVSVTLSGDVSLAQGDTVTLVVQRDSVSGEAVVRGAEKQSRVVERLARGLEQTEKEAKDKGDKNKQQEADRLRLLVGVNSGAELSALQRARDRASEQAKAGLENALKRVEDDHKQRLDPLKIKVGVQLNGVVQVVDTSKNTITVKSDDDPAVTLNVTATTDMDGAKLADLKAGQRVRVTYDRQSMNALSISLKALAPAKVKGAVSAVDAAQSTVTIKPEEGNPVVLKVTADTIINRDDKEKDALANIAVGDRVVEAHYNPVTMGAFLIVVHSPKPAEFSGNINAIDAAGSTITILSARLNSLTLKVNAQTEIQKNGAKAALADLAVNDRVEGRYDVATMTLISLEAKSPKAERFQGYVQSVDAAANTITVLSREGVSITLRLSAKTAIERDGESAALKDILPGDRVVKAYYDATLLAAELEVRSQANLEHRDAERGVVEIKGLITALSAGSWTVAGRALKVDSTTRIVGEGKVGLIAEVQARAQADGSLTALRIEVTGIPILGSHDTDKDKDKARIELHGVVGVVSAGQFTLGNRTVKTDSNTVVQGTLSQGAVVEVQGVEQADGSVLATRIEVKLVVQAGLLVPDRDQDRTRTPGSNSATALRQVNIQGAVSAVSAGQVTVAGQTIKMDSQTVVQGTLSQGVQVEIKASQLADGSLLATRIEVKSSTNAR